MRRPAKIFLVLVAVTLGSLLTHYGGLWNWTGERVPSTDGAPCSPPAAGGRKAKHTDVTFLKTHKTASSTVQNILFRFAERNNLTVALPERQYGHLFCNPEPFSARCVHPHTLPPNIIANHLRFSVDELRRVAPADARYVTILREPAAMFESLFTYYNQQCGTFRRVPGGSLDAFLERPLRYYRPREKNANYARNALTHDLGGDKDRPAADAAYAGAFTARVERDFSLVMIAEYFDESLVLLRRLLSWDPEDLVYVKLNVRAPGSKRRLTPGLAGKVRAWNWIDAHLYDHFNASLWRQLEALGSACLAQELRLLRAAQERLLQSCFGGRPPLLSSAGKIHNQDLRPWQPNAQVGILGYDLPGNLSRPLSSLDPCLKFVIPEVLFTKILLDSQSARYRHNHRH